jgi:hypothetical protein
MKINNFEIGLCPPIEKSIGIYENSCRKYNKNPDKFLYSWEMDVIIADYIQDNGYIQGWGFNTPEKIHRYLRDCAGKSSKEKFLRYDVYVFFNRLPVKFPYYFFCSAKAFIAIIRQGVFFLLWYNTVLKKELIIWKDMKRNCCYTGPDPREKYNGCLKFIPIRNLHKFILKFL